MRGTAVLSGVTEYEGLVVLLFGQARRGKGSCPRVRRKGSRVLDSFWDVQKAHGVEQDATRSSKKGWNVLLLLRNFHYALSIYFLPYIKSDMTQTKEG